MKRIAVLGRGHIGSYVADTLKADGRYDVQSFDLTLGHDLADAATVQRACAGAHAVLDTLPYTLNRLVAQTAAAANIAYFNLTEDVANTEFIRGLRSTAPLIPQCGLAPGMVSILAQHLTEGFESVETIKVRVGALPAQQFNRLGYALTWSPAGLINEYAHPCTVVRDGVLTTVQPLDGAETLMLDGQQLEAAYTSGGIGTLAETWAGRAREVDYKTLRYPGHFDFMRVLRDDLNLAAHKTLAEQWFTSAMPYTREDVVYIGIQVTGHKGGQRLTNTYAQKVKATDTITAIQRTTAHGLLAVVDAYLRGVITTPGFVKQEDIPWPAIRDSVFSKVYLEQ